MWFTKGSEMFPQFADEFELGESWDANRYGISFQSQRLWSQYQNVLAL
jgi:hypothetical protein